MVVSPDWLFMYFYNSARPGGSCDCGVFVVKEAYGLRVFTRIFHGKRYVTRGSGWGDTVLLSS